MGEVSHAVGGSAATNIEGVADVVCPDIVDASCAKVPPKITTATHRSKKKHVVRRTTAVSATTRNRRDGGDLEKHNERPEAPLIKVIESLKYPGLSFAGDVLSNQAIENSAVWICECEESS